MKTFGVKILYGFATLAIFGGLATIIICIIASRNVHALQWDGLIGGCIATVLGWSALAAYKHRSNETWAAIIEEWITTIIEGIFYWS